MTSTTGPAQDSNSSAPADPTAKKGTPVVGIFGLPCSGKMELQGEVRRQLSGKDRFTFFSQDSRILFKVADHPQGKVYVVEGPDLMLWKDVGAAAGEVALYEEYLVNNFTHILYLDIDPTLVAERLEDPDTRCIKLRQNGAPLRRSIEVVLHLHKWQATEREQLRQLCQRRGIWFSAFHPEMVPFFFPGVHAESMADLLRDVARNSEAMNLKRAEKALDACVPKAATARNTNTGVDAHAKLNKTDTFLVLDADKTLADADASYLFLAAARRNPNPFTKIFSGVLGHSYTAYRKASYALKSWSSDDAACFERNCKAAAEKIHMHPEMITLLQQQAKEKDHGGAVVITGSLRPVWEKVLANHGLKHVKVIGGGYHDTHNNYFVTPAVKAALVARLRHKHHQCVWAFSGSPVDILPMLQAANQAIVVVGNETRSDSMDEDLARAMDGENGLRVCQALLPSTATPRLDPTRLPVVQLSDPDFLQSIFAPRHDVVDLPIRLATDPNSLPSPVGLTPRAVRLLHATTSPASQLLANLMRDAGADALRDAHRLAGWYLATEFLTRPDVIGLEEVPIPHVVQDPATTSTTTTTGHRLRDEARTSILAAMRDGEPMAQGVSAAFPLARFFHVGSEPAAELQPHHVRDQSTVILVDSVVNSGGTVVAFVRRIRELHPSVRIVVVAGVVQAQATAEGGPHARFFADDVDLVFVALRVSDNKYTGRGGTDTGNRLFNTTELP